MMVMQPVVVRKRPRPIDIAIDAIIWIIGWIIDGHIGGLIIRCKRDAGLIAIKIESKR
jgi:hypothetical protein